MEIVRKKSRMYNELMKKRLEYLTEKEDAGCTVGRLLKEKLRLKQREISRAKFSKNGILIDGIPVRVDYQVREGERLQVELSEHAESKEIAAVAGSVSILYEDDDVLAVDKPRGILVHPAGGHYYDTLSNQLAAYFENKGEQMTARPVGRLDKDTAGIVLFAKNRAAAARLFDQKERGECKKIYLAWVEGIPEPRKGTITAPIRKIGDSPLRMEAGNGGMDAVTHYCVLKAAEEKSLIQAEIETGRTHQIRVHMAWLGHPLVGDPLYNPKAEKTPGREETYASLYAWRLEFRQPFTGEALCLTSEEIPDFRN